MVGVHNILGHGENHIVRHADVPLCMHDDVAAMGGMFAHFIDLLGRQRTGLVQQPIGHTDLADVVERREARQQIDPFWREIVTESRMGGELLGDDPRVLLGPP